MLFNSYALSQTINCPDTDCVILSLLTGGLMGAGEGPSPAPKAATHRGVADFSGIFWFLVDDMRAERDRKEFERLAYGFIYLLLGTLKKHKPRKYVEVLSLYILYLIFKMNLKE